MNNALNTEVDGLVGLVVLSNGDVTVQCSRLENNGEYGIWSELDGGTLTLNGSTFANNERGDTYLEGGTLVDNPGYTCKVVSSGGKKSVTGNGLPLNVIHVTGGEKHNLSCNDFSGTELILPNGDRVIIPCPNGDEASLDSVTNGELPGILDGNFSFISGLDASVKPALIDSMTVSFMIPAGQQDINFTILHWDGTKWEDLGGYKSSDTFFKVQSSSTGIFVLASK
jgi:hypothetical protein